jgi:hypothetical protein
MSFRTENPAQRRYQLRIGIAMGLYIILIAAEHRLMGSATSDAARYALAALPALPVMACFALMGRYLVEEKDEYIRTRTATQSLWATGVTLAAATLWGFLEDAGAPHVPMFYVAIGWFGALGLVACFRKVLGQ